MKHSFTLLRATLVVGALALPMTVAGAQRGRDRGWGNEGTAKIDTLIPFLPQGSISIQVPSGDVVVRSWNKSMVQIHATSEDRNLRFDASGSRLTIESTGYDDSDDSRIELTVPVGVSVTAQTRSGDIDISGTKGEIEANAQNGDVRIGDAGRRLEVSTLSGDVEIGGVAGDTRVRAISGDVSIQGPKGDVEVEAVSGDIEVKGADSRYVRLRSTSGDVTYAGSIAADGRYELISHSGDVAITVPQKTGAQMSVSTWSGEIVSDFPITLKPGEHGIGIGSAKRFTFEIGNASSRISLESFSGDVMIRTEH